ncbi:SDR family mycofactocin-dependent oxidoreductase [Mycolicibacterium duvalii]|uniref:3-ketoacyl-ACP reductase n=1 Tax=Mycolicibacterium duvalii TaxID=39688 RepID=A0A7I7K3G0_9MYCO|nr:mycofactocin-coupled SDR family oxidoreductase [Mycolicibacterium duvalii]MCV7370532.1 mycofactocin-coupled SDR family oxidoreductase [Mycolicibacterium duvalii]PEG39831.1 SDR family mycofactocin-dependent oxidoreductase [Mycolicibacterium duvalii]BBX18088.1 3-ketoacyl-ACP reductase [Mycolicibacterium duvalii]
MNRLKGKVALVTGAARGQGRSHAVHLADEGADIIALDICADIESNEYPLATPADLDETADLVEKAGQRVVTAAVDVRDRAALMSALEDAVAQLGGLHVVVANAGICPQGNHIPFRGFIDAFDVDFVGVVNTIHVSLDHLGSGGSIIATGSIAGLIDQKDLATGGGPQGPGGAGYGMAKKMIRDYTKALALTLAPHSIRVNAVHPTNVNTDMLHNQPMYKVFRPDLPEPSREDAELVFPVLQAMPTPWVEPEDISHAVVYLASDEARFVTGQQLFVDAGAALKIGV